MKKNHTMRAASLLLVLTLITSCFVGGTFAKYTTKIAGSDTARVAKFGVELTADSTLFEKSYGEDDPGTPPGTLSVLADNDDDVIAPGTTGTATFFTISGDPEVDVQVTASLGAFTMVTLPAGTYTDYTVNKGSEGIAVYDDYNLADPYKPVKWTLTKTVGGTTTTLVDAQNLDAINDYLVNTLSGKYEVENTDSFKAINGDYAITWNWAFDADTTQIDDNDRADTTLGQIAAGVVDATGLTDYVAKETFAFSMTVEQVN